MNIKIGTAPDSWGVWFPQNEKQIPWERCMNEMADLQLRFPAAKYVVLIDDCYTDLFTGELIRPQVLNNTEWDRFIQNIDRIKNHAKAKYGLQVVFHPHAQSHVETEEQKEGF